MQGAGASPKKRRALLQALEGSYAAVASQPAGSYFVEKCYALAVSQGLQQSSGRATKEQQEPVVEASAARLGSSLSREEFSDAGDGWQVWEDVPYALHWQQTNWRPVGSHGFTGETGLGLILHGQSLPCLGHYQDVHWPLERGKEVLTSADGSMTMPCHDIGDKRSVLLFNRNTLGHAFVHLSRT